ncbi:MAG: MFS transporter [Streptosporangiaceae bacterium]|nr:MFS transporter [Actinomycetota bacterium]
MPFQADRRAPDSGPESGGGARPGSSFLGDLRVVLAERGFRRLFATRLISQAGDGAFTAGLGTYVFFNATTYPNPASAAGAFAVLYLPYSLIGPFAGVFIDRWSRRQILVWSAIIRAGFVALTASLVASGRLGLPLYAAALLVLGVNRFFLASLSASLPHVVPEDELVMANGVSPTAGGIMTAIGGIVALGVHVATGGGRVGSAITLLAAGCCYLLAGAAASTMRRDLLGPARNPDERRRGSALTELAAVAASLGTVAAGLAAGARYVWHRRGPTAALGATGGNKFLYGILFLMSILLYRNYFYPASANSALAHFSSLIVLPAAIGYGASAFVTPPVIRRISKQAWIAVALACAGVLTGALGETFIQLMFVVIAFSANLAGQSVAISATTILQEEVEDGFRGRVFSFYDMLSNVPFVLGAALSALFMPDTGRSSWIIGAVAAGYLVVAGCYWAAVRQDSRGAEAGPASPSDAAQSSSS